MTGSRPTETATAADLDAMRDTLDGRRKDHVRAGAILCALAGGLRRGEVCALSVADFTTLDGVPVLRVRTLKRRQEIMRLVPLLDADADLVAKYVRQEHGASPDPAAPLFRTAGTRHPCVKARLTPKALAYTVRMLRREAGIARRLTAHSFRHGFATGLVERGANLKVIQTLLGHANIGSTDRYLHTTFAQQADAVRGGR